MTGTGAVLLGEVARRQEWLEVACDRCGRRGRYRTARLVARHGAGMGLPDLLAELSRDCPNRASASLYDRCAAHYARPA
jgi:hypothetical protein